MCVVLVQRRTKLFWSALGIAVSTHGLRWSSPLLNTGECVLWSRLPLQGKWWRYWRTSKEPQKWLQHWRSCIWEEAERSGTVSHEEQNLRGILEMFTNTLRKSVKKMEAYSCQWCPVKGPEEWGTHWEIMKIRILQWGWWNAAIGCEEWLPSLHPWRCLWAACSNYPCWASN